MPVSVICTVLNEGESIRRLLDSLVGQTRRPDEIVFTDGGSSDQTVAIIQSYDHILPLRVASVPGANISQGRNAAIRVATGDIIASTDAGVWLEPEWLALLVAPLDERSGDGHQKHAAVAGFFVADPHTIFEIALGATVLPAVDDVSPVSFLPSSRSVAFTKTAWEAAGGYPEWLDYCEDLIFDMRLRDESGGFAWAPDAVAHFRPRKSLAAFFTQYLRYARGDGKADLWRKRHAIRYVTYLFVVPLVLFLCLRRNPLWLLALFGGAMAYCRTPYRRLQKQAAGYSDLERVQAATLVPLIRVAGDVAKMIGYPAGWLWRLRNWPRPEIHWQRSRKH